MRTVWTWVYHIIGGSGSGTYGYAKIEKASGERVKITEDVDDIEGVRELVQQGTFRTLLEPVRAVILQGGVATFGPIGVRRDGLVKGGDFKPWREIESANVWDGKFSVKLQGKTFDWIKLKTKRIPNVHVFLSVVEHFRYA